MSTTYSLAGNYNTTIAKELIVAVSGIALVLFILMHLLGNLLIFAGPEAFNGYAEKLVSLGGLLWVARIGLIVMAVAHIWGAASLTRDNRRAKGQRYAVRAHQGRKTFASRTMIYTGIIIFLFLFLHLYDFTFGEKTGPGTIVKGVGAGTELGLYGLVYNAFANPLRSIIYVIAMIALGLHLSHAIASVVVTLGLLRDKATHGVERTAQTIAVVVAVGFSVIPLYFLLKTWL